MSTPLVRGPRLPDGMEWRGRPGDVPGSVQWKMVSKNDPVTCDWPYVRFVPFKDEHGGTDTENS